MRWIKKGNYAALIFIQNYAMRQPWMSTRSFRRKNSYLKVGFAPKIAGAEFGELEFRKVKPGFGQLD